jgi:UDP-N-acetylmuramyl pentapeptide phosphotransferase/UDP-N-acetylglucosamine-1-phosphate transferase
VSGPSTARRAVFVLAGAAGARLALGAAASVTARPSGTPWRRTNYAGRPVTLLGGPALAGPATLTAALGAPAGTRAAAVVVGTVAGAVGAYDDVVGARPEQARDKGIAGHLAALKAGRVSAGAVKVAGIGAAAVVSALLTRRDRSLVDGVLTTGLVAGTANLVNLLDLRPGRAGKTFMALGAVLTLGSWDTYALQALGLFIGPALVLLPYDLRERAMLGDAGSNVLGAVAGLWLVLALGPTGEAIALGVLALFTVYGEFRSISAAVDRNPLTRWLDSLGRRSRAWSNTSS